MLMNYKIIENIIEYIKDYTNNYSPAGLVRFTVDAVLVGITLFFVIKFFLRHSKKEIVLLTVFSMVALFAIISILDLWMMLAVYKWALVIFIGVVIVYYAPEIRAYLGDIVRSRTTKSFASDEVAKEQLINTLVTTVDYLSKRSIGALITIEKEHSLNTYIEKAIRLESAISFELLSTIFLPGTPLHDGAVIIRGTTLMCAGAFLPSSDKADIPKNLGSRHRAAIGISEVSDAFTIVVSEETGHNSTTIDGTITTEVTIDNLRLSLMQNIIVK